MSKKTTNTTPHGDPWPLEGLPSEPPCGCSEPRPAPPLVSRTRPTPAAGPNDDGLRQIVDLLRCLFPDREDCFRRLRKPKTPAGAKLADLCGWVPMRIASIPAMMLALRRHRDGVPSGEPFETTLRGYLDGLPAERLAVLRRGLDNYDALPSGHKECLFETRFDGWANDLPLDRAFLAKSSVLDLIGLGRKLRHGAGVGLQPFPGQVRLWETVIPSPSEPALGKKRVGPWPWICAVNPEGGDAETDTSWFRNQSAGYPDLVELGKLKAVPELQFKLQKDGPQPNEPLRFRSHEFDRECRAVGAPSSGGLVLECGPGGLSGTATAWSCANGSEYEVTGAEGPACLRVPSAHLGTEIGLRGFNFFSLQSRVRVRHVEGGHPSGKFDHEFEARDVQGDPDPPPGGHANCAVRDTLYFTFPERTRQGLNDVLVPAGRYRVEVVVPNEIHFAPEAGQVAPKEFVSNWILIDMFPGATVTGEVTCESAFCERETRGLGGDEAWFRSFSVTADLPRFDQPLRIDWNRRGDIFDQDDVDSKEWITINGDRTLWSGALKKNQVMAIGVIGVEVDDRDLAKKEIHELEKAFAEFFDRWFSSLGELQQDKAVLEALAEKGTEWILAAGTAGLFLLFSAVVFAQWARADLLAYDLILLSSLQLARLTDPDPSQVPPAFSTFHRGGMGSVGIDIAPLPPKVLEPGGETAVYKEEHTYRSPSEESRYRLVYTFRRTS
jgi:hypothetical protein